MRYDAVEVTKLRNLICILRDEKSELNRLIKQMRQALHTHACPDDGSIDTRCYPDNHNCPARELSKEFNRTPATGEKR